MVKKFLSKVKKHLTNRLSKKNTLDDFNLIVDEINGTLDLGNKEDARKLYSELELMYKQLDGDTRKSVFKQSVELKSKILGNSDSATRTIQSLGGNYNKVADDTGSIEQPISSSNLKEVEDSKDEVDPDKIVFIKTGVPGFDDLIEDGIPTGSNILVSGSAGSGKTTFTSQLLMNNAVQGKKCLYMSFEESETRMKRHLRQYGWDPDDLEKKGTLMIKRYDPFSISRSIEALLAKARGELLIQVDKTRNMIPQDFNPDIVVVDSLSAIAAAFAENEAAYRIYIEQLFRSFEKIGITSFLITECEEGTNKLSKTGVEEFLADGVIAFYNLQKGNSRISATEVVKLRGTGHKKKRVPFSFIKGKGIEVYPLQEIFND